MEELNWTVILLVSVLTNLEYYAVRSWWSSHGLIWWRQWRMHQARRW